MNMRELVKRLPYPIKGGLKRVYGALPPRIRYGKVFWETYSFLQESQWWSKEKLEEYQVQQLNKLLSHAYKMYLTIEGCSRKGLKYIRISQFAVGV